MCSSLTPLYWSGISQPANSTILAPAATWRSNRGVRRKVMGTAPTLASASGRGRSRPFEPAGLSAQERRDVDLLVGDLQRGPLALVDPRTPVAARPAVPASGPAGPMVEAGADHGHAH